MDVVHIHAYMYKMPKHIYTYIYAHTYTNMFHLPALSINLIGQKEVVG